MLQDGMRLLGQVLSLLFGSSGVFMLWASFYVPDCGAIAVLFLPPEPPSSSPRVNRRGLRFCLAGLQGGDAARDKVPEETALHRFEIALAPQQRHDLARVGIRAQQT